MNQLLMSPKAETKSYDQKGGGDQRREPFVAPRPRCVCVCMIIARASAKQMRVYSRQLGGICSRDEMQC